MTRLHVTKWGVMLTHFLKGATPLSWNHECQDVVLAEGSGAVSREKFELFMHDSFGLLQLATEFCSAYDVMVQSDYDTVSQVVGLKALPVKLSISANTSLMNACQGCQFSDCT